MNLSILISGPSASGKSAIAQLIAQALGDAGIVVTLDDLDAPRHPDRLKAALSGIATKSNVAINVVARGIGPED